MSRVVGGAGGTGAGVTGAGVTVEFHLPVADGSPELVRQLAGAYERLADEVAAWVGRAGCRLAELGPLWSGRGALACGGAAGRLDQIGGRIERALRHCARELDDYARRLEAALQDHGWSLSKLVALGAIVVLTGAAVVATMGGAAAVAGTIEAGEAATAAEGVSAAAGAAEAAGEQAAAGLLEGSRAMAELREMTRFLLPHLSTAEFNGGMSAFLDELHRGRISYSEVADSMVAGLGGSFVSEQVGVMLAERWAGAATTLRRIEPYAVQGGLGAAGNASQKLSEDEPVTGSDLLLGAAQGAGGAAAGQLHTSSRLPPVPGR